MTDPGSNPRPLVAPSTLERWGRTSWLMIGIVVLTSIAYAALASVAGIVVPLVIAIVIGMLATPIVDRLEGLGVRRSLATGLTIVGILFIVAGSVALAVRGLVDQSDEIGRQLTAGLAQIDAWSQDLDIDIGDPVERGEQAKRFGIDLIPGLAAWLGTAFSGVISFLVGSFIGVFLLYFVLADWKQLRSWVGRNLGVPADVGEAIIDDATSVMRDAFAALTLSSLVTAVLIGGTMAAMGVPLAFTVAVVTFFTSYIPYLGAIFSAAFACLVALGAAGALVALLLLVVILVVQNVVQTVVVTKLTSDRLSIHPMASLISTVIGASLAGLLGATLSTPVLATVILVRQRIQGHEPAPGRPGGRG